MSGLREVSMEAVNSADRMATYTRALFALGSAMVKAESLQRVSHLMESLLKTKDKVMVDRNLPQEATTKVIGTKVKRMAMVC